MKLGVFPEKIFVRQEQDGDSVYILCSEKPEMDTSLKYEVVAEYKLVRRWKVRQPPLDLMMVK